jgi:protein-S-isoprenylcysteine O-methyltransferase Ste14
MLTSYILLAALWIIFCVLHSVLADNNFKKRIAASMPGTFKNYRFFYTVFAFVNLFAIVWYQIQMDRHLVFQSSVVSNVLGWMITITGAIIMLVCIKKYFLSLSGLKSLFAEQVIANELKIDGVHRFVRHPLYLGTFIFIWGFWIVYPYFSLLISNLIITIYTLIGIKLEENKLIEEFGEDYVQYRKQVPMIFPLLKVPNSK